MAEQGYTQFTFEDEDTGAKYTVYSGGKKVSVDALEQSLSNYLSSGPSDVVRQQVPMTQGGHLVVPHNDPWYSQAKLRGSFEGAVQPVRNVAESVGNTLGGAVAASAPYLPFVNRPLTSEETQQTKQNTTDILQSPVQTPENLAMLGASVAGAGPLAMGAAYGATQLALTPGQATSAEGLGQTLQESAFTAVAGKVFNVFGKAVQNNINTMASSVEKDQLTRQYNTFLSKWLSDPEEFKANPKGFMAEFNKVNKNFLKANEDKSLAAIYNVVKERFGEDQATEAAKSLTTIKNGFDKISKLDPNSQITEMNNTFSDIRKTAQDLAKQIIYAPRYTAPGVVNTEPLLANDPQTRLLFIQRLKQTKAYAGISQNISPLELEKIISNPLSTLDTPSAEALSIFKGNAPRTRLVWEGLFKNVAEYEGAMARAELGANASNMSNAEAVQAVRGLDLKNLVNSLQGVYRQGVNNRMLGTVLNAVAQGESLENAMASAGRVVQYNQMQLDKISKDIAANGLKSIANAPLDTSKGPYSQGIMRSALEGAKRARGISGAVVKGGIGAIEGGMNYAKPQPAAYTGARVFNPGAIELIKRELFGPGGQ